jgi:hypothetical protein
LEEERSEASSTSSWQLGVKEGEELLSLQGLIIFINFNNLKFKME